MEEIGKVIEVKGNLIKVVLPTKELCKHCGACLSTASGKEAVAEAENKVHAQVGDLVKIEIKEKTALLATFVLYGFPLVFFFLGYFLGSYLSKTIGGKGEGIAILSAFIFLSFSFFLIRLFFGPQSKRASHYYPIATEIVEKREDKNGN